MTGDMIHRDELRCRAEAWAEDAFALEPDNFKYNALLNLIDESEIVGTSDVETEKLISTLRYCAEVVNNTENTGHCDFCPYRDNCSDLNNDAADALERLSAEIAPVVHGFNRDHDYPSLFECSICGWNCGDTYSGDGEYHYCPNCGAKMDGTAEETSCVGREQD